jgi:ribosomal 30S subunit maturation factor RimM
MFDEFFWEKLKELSVVKMFSHRDGGKIDETFDEDSRNLADIRREKSSKTWNKLP